MSNHFRGWIKKLAIAIVAINLVLGLVLRFFYDDIDGVLFNGFLYRTVVWGFDLTGTLFYPAILVIIYLLFVGDKAKGGAKKNKWKKSETGINKDALVYQQGADTAEELIERFNFNVDYHDNDNIFIDKTTTNIIIKTSKINNRFLNKENRSPPYVMLRKQDVRYMTKHEVVIEFELYDTEVPFVLSSAFRKKAWKTPWLLASIIAVPFTLGLSLLMLFGSTPDPRQLEQYYRRIFNMWGFEH